MLLWFAVCLPEALLVQTKWVFMKTRSRSLDRSFVDKKRRFSLVFAAFSVAASVSFSSFAFAAAKPKPTLPPPDSRGRLVVRMEPVENVRIEMPDGKFHDFGVDLVESLTTRLTNNTRGRKFQVVMNRPTRSTGGVQKLSTGETPDYEWDASWVPAATIRFSVEALNFTTGARGDRMFYGFDERFRTEFNSGEVDGIANEFPLRSQSIAPNWFESSFDQRGGEFTGSRAGLDIGQGVGINLIYAWLAVKYASYRSRVHLRMDIDAPLEGLSEYRNIQVSGQGFYFDIAGAYAGYSAGIALARSDAMGQALGHAIDGSQDAVIRALENLRLTARVDGVNDGYVLLGTGFESEIPPGTRYEVTEGEASAPLEIEVIKSFSAGSLGRVVRGELSQVRTGMILREVRGTNISSPIFKTAAQTRISLEGAPEFAASESLELPPQNIPKPDFQGLEPKLRFWEVIKRVAAELPTLGYRVWRYFQYDRAYQKNADRWGVEELETEGRSDSDGALRWAETARSESFSAQMGLTALPLVPAHAQASEFSPVVAVIDSGVDYNHPSIHSQLWLNPAPVSDSRGLQDRYGWDFIAGDSRAADDGHHGTAVASTVLAVAPHARVMPLKIFNPWGVTSSAAILGAFKYAVDHGAQVILCAWSTRRATQAVERGVEYARDHGVLVVAAAGDRGDDLSQVASYPAVLSREFENVLTVASVDGADQLVRESGRYSNFGKEFVGIAAPGLGVRVAAPRLSEEHETSSGVAAAIVAGAAARLIRSESVRAVELVTAIQSSAVVVPDLESHVSGGLRLRIAE